MAALFFVSHVFWDWEQTLYKDLVLNTPTYTHKNLFSLKTLLYFTYARVTELLKRETR